MDSSLFLSKHDSQLQNMNSELLDSGGSVPPEALMTTWALIAEEGYKIETETVRFALQELQTVTSYSPDTIINEVAVLTESDFVTQ